MAKICVGNQVVTLLQRKGKNQSEVWLLLDRSKKNQVGKKENGIITWIDLTLEGSLNWSMLADREPLLYGWFQEVFSNVSKYSFSYIMSFFSVPLKEFKPPEVLNEEEVYDVDRENIFYQFGVHRQSKALRMLKELVNEEQLLSALQNHPNPLLEGTPPQKVEEKEAEEKPKNPQAKKLPKS